MNVAAPSPNNFRRGLPRVVGGEPWPPAGPVSVTASPVASAAEPARAEPEPAPVAFTAAAGPTEVDATSFGLGGAGRVRRGLPRVAGGEPWPAPVVSAAAPVATPPAQAPVAPTIEQETPAPGLTRTSEPAPEPTAPSAREEIAVAESGVPWGAAERSSRTLAGWVRLGVFGVLGAVVVAALIVLVARGVTTLPGVPKFLVRFPGEYPLPEIADPGFPAWARWTHFLNFFLIVLIIRSGLQVRYQRQPPAFFTPRRGGKKVSLNLWAHTCLDVLWLVNGAVFVVLLFVSGHWARIIPTSWEVFPNAVSALLQYLTLDWPVENGWVNYNSLQQLMYFLVVFVAAPLAAITGLRMSEWWPKDAKTLNRVYPAPLARALHFPTMLFFVVFIVIHVFLVFATGALRNLNHMFAGADLVNWAGFWWFVAGIVVTGGAVAAARPLVLAPIAGLFGKVSSR